MQRSQLLDLLRLLAISLVFLAHFGQLFDSTAGQFFGIKNFYYVSLGGMGVSIFLVLSGLLAGLTDLTKPIGYFRYLWKKLCRIYPIYWLTIPVTILGYVLNGLIIDGSWPTLFPNGFIWDGIGSVTGFYAWFGLWGGPYNPPSWFIGLIIPLYAIFPMLAACIKRAPNVTLIILLAISIISRWYIGQYGLPFIETSMIEDVESWLYRQYGFMPGRPGDWFLLCRLFEFGLGVWVALKVPTSFWYRWRLGRGRLLAFLSDLSFPLFLLHYPFLFIALWWTDLGMNHTLAITLLTLLLIVGAQGIMRLEKRLR
ncbi:acyltransferase [Marinomonas piezotolerans]|uniref:Acyltransferase n=1 Tax=Marinomonas piezotolerans TaxID=2213058 RepID=A0A370U726_9GAMM|nr:acyltransferase family protein [Marinomonas piezotolerans]RDL43562.1 acyltransferase [Marinomonas piezotolerans]